MMNFNIKHEQVETQAASHVQAQLTDVTASFPVDATNSQAVSEDIKCLSPMTFSQKLYQSHAQEIAEEFEQAIDANSLEKIKNLFDKILEIDLIEGGA